MYKKPFPGGISSRRNLIRILKTLVALVDPGGSDLPDPRRFSLQTYLFVLQDFSPVCEVQAPSQLRLRTGSLAPLKSDAGYAGGSVCAQGEAVEATLLLHVSFSCRHINWMMMSFSRG